MDDKKIFGLVGVITLAILVLGIVFTNKTQPPELEQTAMAAVEVIDENSHDWGKIDINGGNMEKTFQIKNNGEGDLEITNVKTSCMCTEARIAINGKNSPVFGMHTRSGWSGVIEPGQTAEIIVVFDPLFHGPQGTGPITRLISFNTNDSENPTVEFKLTGNVVN
jgi:hypothetical protein